MFENVLAEIEKYKQENSNTLDGSFLLGMEKAMEIIKEMDVQEKSYLTLPSILPQNEYKQLIENLKKDGAIFDQEQKQWYILDGVDQSKFENYLGEVAIEPHTEAFRAVAYSNSKTTVIYGDTKEELVGKLNSWNHAREEDSRFKLCYVSAYDSFNKQYTAQERFEVDSGRNITKMYLTLPKLPREEFKLLTLQLSTAGAKFESSKKLWYIMPDQKDEVLRSYLSEEFKNADYKNIYLPTLQELSKADEELLEPSQEPEISSKKESAREGSGVKPKSTTKNKEIKKQNQDDKDIKKATKATPDQSR